MECVSFVDADDIHMANLLPVDGGVMVWEVRNFCELRNQQFTQSCSSVPQCCCSLDSKRPFISIPCLNLEGLIFYVYLFVKVYRLIKEIFTTE